MAKAKQLPSRSWRVLKYAGTDDHGKRVYKSFTADTPEEAEFLAAKYALDHKDERKKKSSSTAKKYAEILSVKYIENKDIDVFPRIKCNIGRGELGEKTKIYHLPMDLNYDRTKVDQPGEMMALTVADAEAAGFRRAYKWHGLEA